MNPIYIDALWWICYGVMAVCVAGGIFVLSLLPFIAMAVASGVVSGKKD